MQEKINPRLKHPISTTPDLGGAVQVCPGVFWIRLPIPFELNHINVWLLEDGDGYTLIDTGISARNTREAWEEIFKNVIKGKPIHKIIVTHFHPDHFGLCNWLCERTNAEYFTSEETLERVGFLLDVEDKDNIETRMEFYQRHEISDVDFFEDFLKGSLYTAVVSGAPAKQSILEDGENIKIGENIWQVIMTYGHAPGHINLYCEALNILISGDQVLPTITSNMSVHADQPNANPLEEYLQSFDKLAFLPDNTLVLPSHGKVFEGVHIRIAEVVAHHHETLDKVFTLCEKSCSASELMPNLFRRKLEGINSVLAFGETLAHLNYLCEQGRLKCTVREDRYIYQH
jgi:glyoxylase-like metal-dependent hydrolase (beta-lactamase superfamily II)